jgi:nicotinamide-nucleotide amidase
MWHDSVRATLNAFITSRLNAADERRRVIRRRMLHCFGAGESRVEAMLPDLIRRGLRPTVGITASQATITLRIVADGETEQECFKAIAPVETTIRDCLGDLVYGTDEEQLQDVVVRLLRERGMTLTVADVGTGGMLMERLGSVAGWRDVVQAGMVLAQFTESVETTAASAREQLAADFGLAVGPLPEEGETPESPTVAIALASASGVRVFESPTAYHPALTRIYLTKQALNAVRLALLQSKHSL